jgi:hypothetical protein
MVGGVHAALAGVAAGSRRRTQAGKPRHLSEWSREGRPYRHHLRGAKATPLAPALGVEAAEFEPSLAGSLHLAKSLLTTLYGRGRGETSGRDLGLLGSARGRAGCSARLDATSSVGPCGGVAEAR